METLVHITRLWSISKPEGKNEINLGSVYHIVEISGCSSSRSSEGSWALQPLQPQIIDILLLRLFSSPYLALSLFAFAFFPHSSLSLSLFLPFARRFVFIFPSLAIFIHPPAAFRRETLLTVKNFRFVTVFSFQTFHKTDTRISVTSFPAFSRLKNLVFGYNQATLSPLSFVYELEKSGQILFVLFSLNGISSFWRCICSIVSVQLLSPPPSFFSILLLS